MSQKNRPEKGEGAYEDYKLLHGLSESTGGDLTKGCGGKNSLPIGVDPSGIRKHPCPDQYSGSEKNVT